MSGLFIVGEGYKTNCISINSRKKEKEEESLKENSLVIVIRHAWKEISLIPL